MSDIVLLLGPIAFQGFEVPPVINFGGRQRLALHRLPGGTRVIDAMGRDDSQISFAGVFSGSDATWRALSLDELRVAGLPLPLTWDVFFYTVVISEFWADYQNTSWIPYRIVCTVLQDEASMLLQFGSSVAAAALADVGSAAAYASDAGLELGALHAALAAPGATTNGTTAYVTAQSAIDEAKLAMETNFRSAEASLGNAGSLMAGSARDSIAGLIMASDATLQVSSLTTSGAYLRRASLNVSNAST